MNTRQAPAKANATKSEKKKKKEVRVEQSLGIRVVALTMNLLLVIASASYVPTLPVTTFLFAMTAILGSYLAYVYRNSRPGWVSTIPTVATILLFTNFFFELFTGYTSGAYTAVGAFIHMLTGLLALHCFDLRSRTDFSISALIGLGLLTCLAGMAKDLIYGFYIFTYTVLAGLLLFYDSSSRSHEIGPSRTVPTTATSATGPAGATKEKPQVVKRLRITSLSPLIPVFALPIISALAFTSMPRIDSVIDIFKDNFVRAKFPISANLSDQLGKGGRSQSIRGGAPDSKKQGGASYTAQKSNQPGTASGSGGKNDGDKDGKGHGDNSGGLNGGSGSGGKGLGGGKVDKKAQAEAEKARGREQSLNQAYQKEAVELKGSANQMEDILLKVSSPQPTYIRRFSLNDFDGIRWTRSMPVGPTTITPTPNSKIGFDLTASDAVYVPPSLPTLEVKQDFRVEQDNVFGHILPSTWIPQLVKQKGHEDEEIKIDVDGTIKLVSPLNRGSSYSVVSQVPIYDFDQMRHLQLETLEQVTEDRESELKVAQSCQKPYTAGGEQIQKLAGDITGVDGNWFYRADRICEYLRKNYKYDPGSFYEDDKSVVNPSDTSDTTAETSPQSSFVEDFLFVKKKGNCRHFATAFAILCRAQGIPARIVTGYLPGQLNKTTGYWEVRGKHAHVWAEIYLPYWNWVPFDATPGGLLPAHEEGGNPLTRLVRSGLANPFGQNYTASRKPRKQQGHRENQKSDGDADDKSHAGFFDFGTDKKDKHQKVQLPVIGSVDQGAMQQVFKYSIVFIALLALLLILYLYLKQRKETQLKEFMIDHKPSTLIYLDVLAELKRYELLKHPTETADELSLRLVERSGEIELNGRPIPDQLPAMVSEFMAIYSEDRFGGLDKLDELAAMSGRIKSLAKSKGRK